MIYRQVFILGIKKAFIYRVNFYMGLISIIFPLTIQYFLWSGLYSNSEQVFGYEFPQMLAYSFFAALVTKIISTSFVYEINTDIKEGGLAKYLVKPLSYFRYNLMGYLGEKAAVIFFASLIIIAVWAAMNIVGIGGWDISRLLMFFLALTLGIILNFIIFYSVCSIGFWMLDAGGVIFITTLVGTIVSGGIFPLDIFSPRVQFLLRLLPFPYTSYYPVSILCGTAEGLEIIEGFALQVLWIFICAIFAKVIWKFGMKKYVSVGG